MLMDENDKRLQQRPIRNVWLVSREYEGLAGAGGVKDVTRQLAETLCVQGETRVSVIMPRYGFIDAPELGFEVTEVGEPPGIIGGVPFTSVFSVDMNYAYQERRETVALWRRLLNGVTLYLIESERFAEKQGVYTYTEIDEQRQAWQRKGEGHYDYFAMNILLQKTALDLMILLGEHPDVIHCQDGHAATLPAMMRECCGYRHYFRTTGALVTIHNAGIGYHQEVADLVFAQAVTGLPKRVVTTSQLMGSFDPFIAAAPYAQLNTVSENYARELQQTPEDARTGWLGHALLERGVTLAGITNGIDPSLFDPSQPEALRIAAGYDVLQGNFEGKQRCKEVFLQQLASGAPWDRVEQYGTLHCSLEVPLCTFIGRLTDQKGVDSLLGAITQLLMREPSCCFLVFGSGEAGFEEQFIGLAGAGNGRVCFLKGYDPILANTVYAAGDLFLVPSKYEPCGLTDYIAQLFANIPVVHQVGGLVKVIDGETGFSYRGDTAGALADALARALKVYRDEPDRFVRMQRTAVEQIHRFHTWGQVVEEYKKLYRQAIM